jgi:hypothetical protein
MSCSPACPDGDDLPDSDIEEVFSDVATGDSDVEDVITEVTGVYILLLYPFYWWWMYYIWWCVPMSCSPAPHSRCCKPQLVLHQLYAYKHAQPHELRCVWCSEKRPGNWCVCVVAAVFKRRTGVCVFNLIDGCTFVLIHIIIMMI